MSELPENKPQYPWERRSEESNVAYEAFLTYRDLPAPRSLTAAYESYKARRAGRTDTHPTPDSESIKGESEQKASTRGASGRWRIWSSQHQWNERARAWDNWLRQQEVAAIEKVAQDQAKLWVGRRGEHKEREWKLASALIQKAEEMLKMPLVEVKSQKSEDGKTTTTIVKPMRWSLRDAAQFIEVASKLARLATDMATDRSEHQFAQLSDEQLIARAAGLFSGGGQAGDNASPGLVDDPDSLLDQIRSLLGGGAKEPVPDTAEAVGSE